METIRPPCCFTFETETLKSGTKMQKKPLLKTSRKETGKPASKPPKVKAQPTREAIAQRAYEIYATRGTGGRELEDWVQAERELWGTTVRNN
jgi:hypothetical protein